MTSLSNQIRGFLRLNNADTVIGELSEEEKSYIQEIRQQSLYNFCLDKLGVSQKEIRKLIVERTLSFSEKLERLIATSELAFKPFVLRILVRWDLRKRHEQSKWKSRSAQYNVDNIRRLVKEDDLDVANIMFNLFEYVYKTQGGKS